MWSPSRWRPAPSTTLYVFLPAKNDVPLPALLENCCSLLQTLPHAVPLAPISQTICDPSPDVPLPSPGPGLQRILPPSCSAPPPHPHFMLRRSWRLAFSRERVATASFTVRAQSASALAATACRFLPAFPDVRHIVLRCVWEEGGIPAVRPGACGCMDGTIMCLLARSVHTPQ